MSLYIFNNNGQQRAEFFQATPTGVELLYTGESWEQFTKETKLSPDQLGGFKLNKGKLTYSQALKDAHDAPQEAVQTPLNEVYELTSLMSKLDSTQINALKQAVLAILEA
jgi:hypothetical protein